VPRALERRLCAARHPQSPAWVYRVPGAQPKGFQRRPRSQVLETNSSTVPPPALWSFPLRPWELLAGVGQSRSLGAPGFRLLGVGFIFVFFTWTGNHALLLLQGPRLPIVPRDEGWWLKSLPPVPAARAGVFLSEQAAGAQAKQPQRRASQPTLLGLHHQGAAGRTWERRNEGMAVPVAVARIMAPATELRSRFLTGQTKEFGL
jgi:hypothetical protein